MRGPVARLVGVALAATGACDVLAAPAERYEDGVSAYQKNDFDRSLKTLKPLAEKGDARAQYLLGRHYQFGQGVKADKAEAYFWYKRAEAKGHLEAKLFRQLLEMRWKLSAEDKARGDRKLAEVNAPKKPEKPKVETASRDTAREAARDAARERPAILSRPSAPPSVMPAKSTPDAGREVARETPRVTAPAERNEANRAPPRRTGDDDDGDMRTANVPNYRSYVPPAETRAALPLQKDDPAAEMDAPAHTPPTYTPPTYTQPGYTPPAYNNGPRDDAPPQYASPGYPPGYAPGAAPSWRPPGYYAPPATYYAPPAYYAPAPGWGMRARAPWPGWRNAGWGPGYGFRRYRGY